jgi:hypothetical protein
LLKSHCIDAAVIGSRKQEGTFTRVLQRLSTSQVIPTIDLSLAYLLQYIDQRLSGCAAPFSRATVTASNAWIIQPEVKHFWCRSCCVPIRKLFAHSSG